MGDGTKENPYTREDVLRLIKKNGNTAKDLDLSGKEFEPGIDLSWLDLDRINLQEASLMSANLQGTELIRANLRSVHLLSANLQGCNLASINLEDASLENANFQEANLASANLQRADLRMANLQRARLLRANLHKAKLWDTNLEGATLEDVKWDLNYIVGDEPDSKEEIAKGTRLKRLQEAASAYRHLKRCHAEQGLYDIAGKFYYREMTAKRKALGWLPNPLPKVRETLYWLLCGYGENPWQAFASAVVVVLALALIYFAIGTLKPNTFPHSLYYSMVSFTALGYGKWAAEPMGWVKWLGACESFLGVFMMALFLVTFTRKMIR